MSFAGQITNLRSKLCSEPDWLDLAGQITNLRSKLCSDPD